MFVVRHKKFFFALSGLLVLASIALVSVWGLKPSVDFAGGSVVLVSYDGERPEPQGLVAELEEEGFEDVTVRLSGENDLFIRTQSLEEGDRTEILEIVSSGGEYNASIERLSSVGSTVGEELRRKTMWAIVLVVIMIILYVAFTFRKVSKPVSSWMYGVIAIITLLHDIIIPVGAFAILGHTIGLEADTLFVVALLTILALSVNDTIVVFDRIREHLRTNELKSIHEPFDETVGKSLQETYVRSFNTSLTILIVLAALFVLGGPTIHSFILTLLVGMISGTYSSIFLASPLLAVFGSRKE